MNPPAANIRVPGGRVLVTAGLILTAAALASRILGWVRLLVIGSQFGASRELDAYFAAFRIPDAIFQLVVAGALSAALIPVFSGYRARADEEEAWRLASSVMNLVLLALVGLSLLMALFAPWLVPLITPGFDAAETELTVRLTRLMLLSPVFVGMGAVATGLLQSYERFSVPALAPLVYNAAIIGAAIVLAPLIGVEGLAVGVVVGSLGHLAVQLPQLARVGRRYQPLLALRHPGVRQVIRLMGPRTLGLAAVQLNFIVATLLATGQPEGGVTAFNYAFQLMQVPVGVVGVSVAVAIFPSLSRDAALGRLPEVRRRLSRALRILLFVGGPITAVIVVLREPLTSVFFQYGLFSAESADRTSVALAFFGIAVAAHMLQHVLARTFYALQDTRTPVTWAVIAVASNIALMLLLVGPMGIAGLALSVSLAAFVEVGGLLVSLRARIGSIDGARVGVAAARAVAAAAGAGFGMLAGLALAGLWVPGLLDHGLGRLAILLALSAAGLALYAAIAALLGSEELSDLRGVLAERLGPHRPGTAEA